MIIFDEPAMVYHANAAIGSSDIRAFLRSPRLFKDKQDGLSTGESPALAFGSVAHFLMLEPEKFCSEVAIKPEFLSLATKEGKEWKAGNIGKTIIDTEQYNSLKLMLHRMPEEVAHILRHCKKEITVRLKIGDIPVQCRPDLWDTEHGYKWDLKTIKSIESIDSSIWKYGYHIQDEWYSHLIGLETGKRPTRSELIFVEKESPYRWRIVSLDPDYQMLAKEQVAQAIRGIQDCMRSDCWDDPEEEVRTIASPPDYALTTINDEE